MPYARAREAVNEVKTVLAGLTRGLVTALADEALTAPEGIALGMQAVQFGMALAGTLHGMTPVERAEMLTVLEQGVITMPAQHGLGLAPGPAPSVPFISPT